MEIASLNPSSRWLLAIGLLHVAACHNAERPSIIPSVTTSTPVVLVAGPPPAPSAARVPTPAAPPDDATDSPADDGEVELLNLVDPEPGRPLPKIQYFIEVRGGDIDAVNTGGCGKTKVPSATYATHDSSPQLILCADSGTGNGPDLTLGIPSARRVGLFEYGRSEFSLEDGNYYADLKLTVEISKFDPVGKAIEGSYVTEVRNQDGSTTRRFFGRFRVLHLPDDPSVRFH